MNSLCASRKYLKKYLVLLFLPVGGNLCFAQDATNHIVVTANTSLSFSFSSQSLFENGQTLSDAISISTVSKSYSCHIYMQLTSWSYPSGATPSYSPLYLDFSSTNASSYSLAGTSFNVTTSNQLLFTQTKTGATWTYKYDLRMAGLDYSEFKPGSYSYTITFTMSQP
jgi:hypothetical protein